MVNCSLWQEAGGFRYLPALWPRRWAHGLLGTRAIRQAVFRRRPEMFDDKITAVYFTVGDLPGYNVKIDN